MESRRNFVKAAFTFGTAVFASAKALAAQHTGHDKAAEHNMHMATDRARHKGRVSQPVLVESPDLPQLPWRMDGTVKEFLQARDDLAIVPCGLNAIEERLGAGRGHDGHVRNSFWRGLVSRRHACRDKR